MEQYSEISDADMRKATLPHSLIVITADFPASIKDSFFQLSYPHLILWLHVWRRYSGRCDNVVI